MYSDAATLKWATSGFLYKRHLGEMWNIVNVYPHYQATVKEKAGKNNAKKKNILPTPDYKCKLQNK